MGVFRELHCLVSVCTRTVTLTFDCQEDEQTPRTDPGPSHVDRFAPCPGAAERAPGVSRRPLWSQVGPQLPSGCQRDIASPPLFGSIGALLGAPFPGAHGDFPASFSPESSAELLVPRPPLLTEQGGGRQACALCDDWQVFTTPHPHPHPPAIFLSSAERRGTPGRELLGFWLGCPISSARTSGKSWNLSAPQFPFPQNGNSHYLPRRQRFVRQNP